jgi:uracil-DNA glycosylase family 4
MAGAMDSRRVAYLKALDIDVWERRDLAPAAAAAVEVPVGTDSGTQVNSASWAELERAVKSCTLCPLHKTRTQGVFGVGNRTAQWMVIGEAPGADEDRQGEPFVGRAGKRLDAWLTEVGLAREDVYIANVLKCRPPGNRDPKPDEVDKCSPFLQAQIRAIAPRVIVALGRHAGMLLSKREDLSLGKMRASRLHYEIPSTDGTAPMRIPLVVTYHPAYVLRQEEGGEAGRSSAEEAALTDLRRAVEACA